MRRSNMLDAYIIEQIRKRQERRDPGLQPLQIEVPRHPADDRRRPVQEDRRKQENEGDRGVVIIDYTI